MKKKVVFEASESEILEILNKHFGTNEDSIVANEELGNEVWVVIVNPLNNPLEGLITSDGHCFKKWCMVDALDKACYDGVIEAGTYLIDCTW